MKHYKKAFSFLTAALTFAVITTGCSSSGSGKSGGTESSVPELTSGAAPDEITTESPGIATPLSAKKNYSDLFSDRDLDQTFGDISAKISFDGSSVSITGDGASAKGSTVTITNEGVYRISGTTDKGQIIVNAPKAKVQLVLDNTHITNPDSSAIYVIDAAKTFITLAPDSTNSLSDGSNYVFADNAADEPDAAVFSEDSLTINGPGSLTINGNYNDGIRCKDDIVITGGSIEINAVSDGIKGKDYIAAADGNITVNAGQDGIKSTNKTDPDMGFIYICGGKFDITAEQDGFQAETSFVADGGDIKILAGGGNENSQKIHNDDFSDMHNFKNFNRGNSDDFDPEDFENFRKGDFEPGEFPAIPFDNNIEFTAAESSGTSSQNISTKGIKAGTEIQISGGNFTIDSADDAIHSNGSVAVTGGEISLYTGEKGIHGDSTAEISGDADVKILTSYEGIEAAVINVSGGVLEVNSSDDGFNASDGSTSQAGMGTYSADVQLNISGGFVYVNAAGDGLDSNGDMTISGGTILIDGPENGGNGALDGNNAIIVKGGILAAAGSSQMAEIPGSNSTQYSVGANVGSCSSGTLVTLTDGSGKEIFSYAPAKTFEHIVISTPDIKAGETYSIFTGGSSDSAEDHGLYEVGGYKNDGTEIGSFSTDSTVSTVGSQGMGGFGGGHHGMGGRQDIPGDFDPGQMQPQTDENGQPEFPEGFDPGQKRDKPDKKGRERALPQN